MPKKRTASEEIFILRAVVSHKAIRFSLARKQATDSVALLSQATIYSIYLLHVRAGVGPSPTMTRSQRRDKHGVGEAMRILAVACHFEAMTKSSRIFEELDRRRRQPPAHPPTTARRRPVTLD
jgi:hypothetical protein